MCRIKMEWNLKKSMCKYLECFHSFTEYLHIAEYFSIISYLKWTFSERVVIRSNKLLPVFGLKLNKKLLWAMISWNALCSAQRYCFWTMTRTSYLRFIRLPCSYCLLLHYCIPLLYHCIVWTEDEGEIWKHTTN